MKRISPFNQLESGRYVGHNTNVLCSVTLEVVLKDGYIEGIEITDKFYTFPLASRAYKEIPKRIIEKQSLDVDAVTAATISTNNIKAAVLDALKKAKR